MQNKHAFLMLLLAFTIVFGQGCTTTVVGPQGETAAVYKFGTLTVEEPSDISAVYEAAENALTKLELNITQKMKDELSAKIVARDSQDKKITVNLASITTGSTKMSIRAGSFAGARRIQEMVHDSLQQLEEKIRDRLK